MSRKIKSYYLVIKEIKNFKIYINVKNSSKELVMFNIKKT